MSSERATDDDDDIPRFGSAMADTADIFALVVVQPCRALKELPVEVLAGERT